MSDAHLDLLREILATLRRMEKSAPAREVSMADRARLAPLLAAIFEAIGPYIWAVKDLHVAAGTHPALAAALQQGDYSSRKLGKLLARADGAVIDGMRIERGVEVREGRLWRVTRV